MAAEECVWGDKLNPMKPIILQSTPSRDNPETIYFFTGAFDGGSVANTLSHSDEVMPKPMSWIRK